MAQTSWIGHSALQVPRHTSPSIGNIQFNQTPSEKQFNIEVAEKEVPLVQKGVLRFVEILGHLRFPRLPGLFASRGQNLQATWSIGGITSNKSSAGMLPTFFGKLLLRARPHAVDIAAAPQKISRSFKSLVRGRKFWSGLQEKLQKDQLIGNHQSPPQP